MAETKSAIKCPKCGSDKIYYDTPDEEKLNLRHDFCFDCGFILNTKNLDDDDNFNFSTADDMAYDKQMEEERKQEQLLEEEQLDKDIEDMQERQKQREGYYDKPQPGDIVAEDMSCYGDDETEFEHNHGHRYLEGKVCTCPICDNDNVKAYQSVDVVNWKCEKCGYVWPVEDLELKSLCAFCGVSSLDNIEVLNFPENNGGGYHVVCMACQALGPRGRTPEEATKMWENRRGVKA